MIHIIADTNLFIQCRALHELPWRKLFDDDELCLLFAPKVVMELDVMKYDGKGRRAKRARKTTELLRRIINSVEPIVLLEKEPRLTVSYTTEVGEPMTRHILKPDYNDHRILLQVLEYQENHPGVPVVFLTHETHHQFNAKGTGIRCLQIPDSWLLEAEPDERDRELHKLRQENEDLLNAAPKVRIAISNLATGADHTKVQITRYPKLFAESIERYVAELVAKHPMVTSFDKPQPAQLPGGEKLSKMFGAMSAVQMRLSGTQWLAPSQSEIDEYQKEKYPAWEKELNEFFEELDKRLQLPQRLVLLKFELDNFGLYPANDALIQISAKGSLLIRAPKDDKTKDPDPFVQLPPPPAAPKGKYVSLSDRMIGRYGGVADLFTVPSLRDLLNPVARAPDRFYWDTSKQETPQESLARSCATWRHQEDPDRFVVEVLLKRPENEPVEWDAVITCKVSAQNIPKPVLAMHKITVTLAEGDIEAAAATIVEEGYPIGVYMKLEQGAE